MKLPYLKPELKNTFEIESNALRLKERVNGAVTEIGDFKDPSQFHPQIKIKRWDNEANVSIRFAEDFSGGKLSAEGDRVSMEKGDKEIHIYPTKISNYQWRRDQDKKHLSSGHGTPRYSIDPIPHIEVNGVWWAREDEVEIKERARAGSAANGSVLIVGLGLGLIHDALKANPNVTSIKIIEVSPEVVDILRREYPDRVKGVTIVTADFYEWARAATELQDRFDFIYGDIFPDVGPEGFNAWERFVEVARPLLNRNGVLEGRIKEPYETHDPAEYESEAHEFEIVLKEKPASNVMAFTLQHKEVDFFYQPELTAEDIERGESRPDSVVGSYAIYHKTKMHNEYRSGKVGHIYRPRIEDAAGNSTWGDLHIDPRANTLTVTIPQAFLDEATYPVRHAAGLTFGYTTAGASGQNTGNVIAGSIFNSPVAGEITGLTWYHFAGVIGGTNNKQGCIYVASSLARLAMTVGGVASVPIGWNDYVHTPAVQIAGTTNYILCTWASLAKVNVQIAFDAGSAGQGNTQALTFSLGAYPDPLVPSTNTNKYSIYARYKTVTIVTGHRPAPFKPGIAK